MSSTIIPAAIRVAAAGLGAAVAGPLGCALGGVVGNALGPPAAELINTCVEKFSEEAAKKLLDTGTDSLVDKLKKSAPDLESAHCQALRLSLIEIRSHVDREFDDWFRNWDRCLHASVPLNLEEIQSSQLTCEGLDTLFRHTMERLDAQGTAIREKSPSVILKTRPVPDSLLADLTTRLPEQFKIHFRALIVTDQYKQAWKEAELDFRECTSSLLESFGRDLRQHAAESSGFNASIYSMMNAFGPDIRAIKTVVEQLALQQKIGTYKEFQDLSRPEAREQVLAALRRFADNEDPRASSVAQLAGSGRFGEATDVAFELARDDQSTVSQLEISKDKARKRAVQSWIQAGDIAVLTDYSRAADAYQQAVTLDPSAIAGWWQPTQTFGLSISGIVF